MNEFRYTYTFIIPHHNSLNLLKRCIDSIPQRFDIQIVVVDDNSNDENKPQLLREDVELISIAPSETKGAGHARNKGLAHALGKWILFPDCDDYYVPDFINLLDSYIDRNIDVLYFNFEYRNGKTGELLPDLNWKSYISKFGGSKIDCDSVKFRHNVPWTKMVRREIIKKYNLRFEEVPNGNDILFSMMVGYYAKQIMVEKEVLYVYQKNEGSILNNRRLSSNARLCKIEHRIKQNEFYKFIGYPEWKISMWRVICGQIWNSKFTLLIDLLMSFVYIYKRRKEWLSNL